MFVDSHWPEDCCYHLDDKNMGLLLLPFGNHEVKKMTWIFPSFSWLSSEVGNTHISPRNSDQSPALSHPSKCNKWKIDSQAKRGGKKKKRGEQRTLLAPQNSTRALGMVKDSVNSCLIPSSGPWWPDHQVPKPPGWFWPSFPLVSILKCNVPHPKHLLNLVFFLVRESQIGSALGFQRSCNNIKASIE